MDAAHWMPASAIAQSFAVHEAALFRYSRRGMLGARWDDATGSWLYDVARVRKLFLHRDAVVPDAHWGKLGEACLAGTPKTRRVPSRSERHGVHTEAAGEELTGEPARAAGAGGSARRA
jgi:hypothetical protein